MSINLDVYVSPYKPIVNTNPLWDAKLPATWPATAVALLTGEREAVLIDALITIAEAQDLVEWIRAKNKTLTTVYITHGHADHFFGLNTILAAFPNAKAITLAEIVPSAREQVRDPMFAHFNTWFPKQLPEQPIVPEAMQGPVMYLEGHEIRPIAVGQSDMAPSSIVHIPDLDAVVAGDVAYNGIHCYLAFTDRAKRDGWLAAIDIIDSLHPKTVIAAHRDPKAPDDDAQAVLNATRKYIRDFDQAVTQSATPLELIAKMMQLYSDLGNPHSLWDSAFGVQAQLGRSVATPRA